MSDLISKRELLKEIEETAIQVEKWSIKEKDRKTIAQGCLSGLAVVREAIIRKPTAYDVDKVVNQLKTDSSVKLYGSGNSDNYLIPVKRAIDIVKDGGIQ